MKGVEGSPSTDTNKKAHAMVGPVLDRADSNKTCHSCNVKVLDNMKRQSGLRVMGLGRRDCP